MFLILNTNQYDKHNVLFSERSENKVINNSDFYRIIYSDEYASFTGVNIEFQLHNVSIEKYFNKIKCCMRDGDVLNNEVSNKIKLIEQDILDKFNILGKSKTPIMNISTQINNNFIKIYSNKFITYGPKLTIKLLLKISGVWESENEYGLTFRFFIS